MGEWLGKYGESVYGTRPWYTYGEGPTKEPEGHFKNREKFLKIKYSAKDMRFATKENVIYVTLLGWPGNKTNVLVKSFSKEAWAGARTIKGVTVLGCDEEIKFTLTDEGLTLGTPSKTVDETAVVFKVELN